MSYQKFAFINESQGISEIKLAKVRAEISLGNHLVFLKHLRCHQIHCMQVHGPEAYQDIVPKFDYM